MNDALRMIPDDHFVWFINSSDWLSGPRSLEYVVDALKPETPWIIGGVERWGDRVTPQHPLPATSADFVKLLASGKTGFPHPAAIMAKRDIDGLGMFDESYRIAGDYDLALRFAETLGKPDLIPHILSVHVPTGLTSRHRMRHALEKLSSRKKTVPSFRWSTEIITQAWIGLGVLGLEPSWTKSFTLFPQTESFGVELDSWPSTK
jgi:hypothetical protein